MHGLPLGIEEELKQQRGEKKTNRIIRREATVSCNEKGPHHGYSIPGSPVAVPVVDRS